LESSFIYLSKSSDVRSPKNEEDKLFLDQPYQRKVTLNVLTESKKRRQGF